jgi:precorrin-6B C5,15-methyltransferase / cobalt-precorrin-6B C5,C15-methyltransferase
MGLAAMGLADFTEPDPLPAKWLSVIGIGEDGLTGLSPVARSLLAQASIIFGGERHLALLSAQQPGEKRVWASPITESLKQVIGQRGQAVCVLASGDPLCYGIGTSLLRHIPITEVTIIPHLSAFSLACARLGWSFSEVETLSLCGRDPALLHAFLYSGAKILLLSADHSTPALVAQQLCDQGWEDAQITVLERLGGAQEQIRQGTAATWDVPAVADLNTLAIRLPTRPGGLSPQLAGLPDTAYHHDGQLTKWEVRAITLAALAPIPGQLLWDVGAGCGSIGIEWLRSDRRCRAYAIEQHPSRRQYIADNAAALGVPHLQIMAAAAPAALQDLPTPDAIFIGGGVTAPKLLETCWQALRPGGRLVVNAVTLESEQLLFQWQQQVGGHLHRMAIQRAEPIGKFLGWKAMTPVTQWVVVKEL